MTTFFHPFSILFISFSLHLFIQPFAGCDSHQNFVPDSDVPEEAELERWMWNPKWNSKSVEQSQIRINLRWTFVDCDV